MKSLYTLLISTLVACAASDQEDSSAPKDSGTADSGANKDSAEDTSSTPEGPMLTGSVEMRDPEMGLAANVEIWEAFSYFTDNTTLIYASSKQGLSCKDAATLLIGERDVDPNKVFVANSCNLLLYATFPPERENFDIQTDSGATATIYCTFGQDESWSYEDGWNGEAWYWTGAYYRAKAWKGNFGFEEIEESGLRVPIELREYEGSFPMEESGASKQHKASGKVSGTLRTQHCGRLKNTAWF